MLPFNQAHFHFWLFNSGITILSMITCRISKYGTIFIIKFLELFVQQAVQITVTFHITDSSLFTL
jgi:hypothetical protein